jgi:hypothetical protein
MHNLSRFYGIINKNVKQPNSAYIGKVLYPIKLRDMDGNETRNTLSMDHEETPAHLPKLTHRNMP